MELRHLRYFVTVAEERNFTRAAERIGIGQPPLSQQIRDLEAEVGAALFVRTRLGAQLTVAGQAFLPGALQSIDHAARATEAARQAAAGSTGTLRLGFTSSSTFNPVIHTLIREYRRRYPGVSVSIGEDSSVRLVERLQSGDLDAAAIRPSPLDQGLDVLHLAREALVVALPAGHRLADRPSVALIDLAHDPFVLFSTAVGLSFLDTVLNACRAAGFEPIRAQDAGQISSIVNLVAAGFGVALVPASIEQVKVSGVAYRPIEGTAPTVMLGLATRRGDASPALANLLSLLPKLGAD
ncbi:LysR family transcriptional regulator [Xylophilus sp. GOD-11R]|uniref:LysR family transcriptional regulator n=1 Tax=Xylophilus sp. GOD-11R TaxID=3089814 RepID=UPI00298C9C0A|nr:LysR family transcriptional regulator [Xylophilus sp. GOD-11R]WPB57137.1 LysR family transcriptional regulator [Xylophilus sp. GOD-11R]